jgi:hypothetical protein
MERQDFVEHFTQNLYKYGYESQEELYKKLPTRYDKIAEVIPLSKANLIKDRKTGNAFIRDTSIIGPDTMGIVGPGQVIPPNDPQEGFPVVGAKKKLALYVDVPYELERDWGAAESYIEDLVKGEAGWGQAIFQGVEDLIVMLFKYAGITAGTSAYGEALDIFGNDVANLTSHTYGSLLYDAVCMANLTGNPRTAKNSSTYYNAITTAGTTVTLANLKTLHNLKTATNAKKENGQPFDNSQKKILVCHNTQSVDWNDILSSKQDPDSASNRANSLYKQYQIIELPGLTTSSQFQIGSANEYSGIKLYLGEVEYYFWRTGNPPAYAATAIRNFILYVKNFRPWAFANCATS